MFLIVIWVQLLYFKTVLIQQITLQRSQESLWKTIVFDHTKNTFRYFSLPCSPQTNGVQTYCKEGQICCRANHLVRLICFYYFRYIKFKLTFYCSGRLLRTNRSKYIFTKITVYFHTVLTCQLDVDRVSHLVVPPYGEYENIIQPTRIKKSYTQFQKMVSLY